MTVHWNGKGSLFHTQNNQNLLGGKTVNIHNHPYGRRAFALFMALMVVLSLFSTTALAVQPTIYRDPVEHWMSAGSRTNELDVNAVVSHETFKGGHHPQG